MMNRFCSDNVQDGVLSLRLFVQPFFWCKIRSDYVFIQSREKRLAVTFV